MERMPINGERPIDSQAAVAEVITESLLCVYYSDADLEVEDLVDHVWAKTGYETEGCLKLIDSMFDAPSTYLAKSNTEGYKTVLAAEGLWLIENCFMNGEDNIDPMMVADKILGKTRYFK